MLSLVRNVLTHNSEHLFNISCAVGSQWHGPATYRHTDTGKYTLHIGIIILCLMIYTVYVFVWMGSSTDKDECNSPIYPCNNGTCDNTLGGYNCTCHPGWTGDHCLTGIIHIRYLLSVYRST